MSYYGEWKMFKRELAEELAKPKPDEKKIEEYAKMMDGLPHNLGDKSNE